MAGDPKPPRANKKVGRGRPPEHSQFPKGVSGNPRGRPPKERDFKKLLEMELDLPVWITENGERARLTKREIIVKNLVNEAAKGNHRALGTLVKLVGTSSEVEDPCSDVDPAEIAAFVVRYLPVSRSGPK